MSFAATRRHPRLSLGFAYVVPVSLLVAVLAATSFGARAGAATRITDPGHNPYSVALDAQGKPVPFDVVASGFQAGHQVFVEQCDGRAPTAPNWSVSLDCDDGSAPAPVIVDSSGVARFRAGDPNHTFQPFVGPSPSSLFSCAKRGTPASNNVYTTCQIRVSSNNTQVTSDQVFLSIVFGGAGSSGGSSSSSTVVAVVVLIVIVAAAAGLFWGLRRRSPARVVR